jgi:hypothetical protein
MYALFAHEDFDQMGKLEVTYPYALYIQQLPTRLVDLNALDDSLRAMCTYAKPEEPSYSTLKAMFELGNFVVGAPLSLACILDSQDDNMADVLHLRGQREFKEKFQWLQYKELRQGKPDKDGKPTPPAAVEVDFTSTWLKDTQQRHYDRVDFLPPPCHCPPHVFNLWDSFDADKWGVESSGDLWGYHELLGLSCGHDAGLMHAKELYYADLIQNPGRNPQAGIATKSAEQGTGKDTDVNMFKTIVGPRYVATVFDPTNELFGTHAVALKHKLLVHVSESEALRKHDQQVKHLLTAPIVTINEKYVRQYNIRNMARWLVTGNEVGMVGSGRRWLFTEQSIDRVGDAAYWVKIYAYMRDKRHLKAVLDHLRSVDLSSISTMQALFAKHTTEAQHEAAVATADHITQWAVEQVEAWQARRNPPAEEKITTVDLYESFNQFGISNKCWKDTDSPSYSKFKFSGELGHRYKPSQALVPNSNMGKKKLAGYIITWAKWRDQLVRHHYMLLPQEESTPEQESGTQRTVVHSEEAVEEVGPTPLTQWLNPANSDCDDF